MNPAKKEISSRCDMVLETFETIMPVLIILTAILAAYFAVKALSAISLKKKDTKLQSILMLSFGSIAIGHIFWAIAEALWSIHARFVPDLYYSIFADPFYMMGYPFLIFGCGYLSYHLIKSSRQYPAKALILAGTAVIIAFSYFLIRTYVLSGLSDVSLVYAVMDVFYPIASMLIIISAIPLLVFFRKLSIRTPFLLLVFSFFMAFIGDSVWTYASWNELGYGLILFSADLLYVLEYSAAALAFYKFSNI